MSISLKLKAFNNQPFLVKGFAHGQSSRLSYAGSWMRGYRSRMEDTHAIEPCVLDLYARGGDDDHHQANNNNGDLSFFAVFDGHLGVSAADYCAKHLLRDHILSGMYDVNNITDQQLKDGFLSADRQILNTGTKSGCVATTCFVKFEEDQTNHRTDVQFICANAGDSRCVLYSNGKMIALSEDHKPSNTDEARRIVAAEGFVLNNRVNGMLAVSRALGDPSEKANQKFPLELQAVTSIPDVKRFTIPDVKKEGFTFLVLACDGVWDKMTSEQVCEFIAVRLKCYDIFSCKPLDTQYTAPKYRSWIETPTENWTEKQYQRWYESKPDGSLRIEANNFADISTKLLEILRTYNLKDQLVKPDSRLVSAITLARFVMNSKKGVSRRVNRKPPVLPAEKLELISEEIIDHVVLQRLSTDNISLIIALLHDNNLETKKYEEKLSDSFVTCDAIIHDPILKEMDVLVSMYTSIIYSMTRQRSASLNTPTPTPTVALKRDVHNVSSLNEQSEPDLKKRRITV